MGIVLHNTYWKACCVLVLTTLFAPLHAMTPPGTVIDNTAMATFDIGVAVGLTENSNTASVTTTIIRTPSSIGFFQFRPGSPTITEEVPSQCRNGAGGGFIPSLDPNVPNPGSGIVSLDPTTALGLAPATIYNAREPVFVQLIDGDQNIDATVAETVEVTVSSSLGDVEQVLLTETDVDTGIFIAYIQSVEAAVIPFNCELSVDQQSTLEANYTDPFDGTDSSSSTTLVDPFGIVFNSLDGQPVDGVTVQLINIATGQPAVPGVDVFGNDGISAFPNTLVTGSTATDSGGTVYNFPVGTYRFPLLVPGDYRLAIIASPGFIAPSSAEIIDLQQLSNAPFALLADASYGQDFVLNPGPPLHVDIPLDPVVTQLIITKAAFTNDAGIGDFVQYELAVENVDTFAVASDTRVTDILPQGFRYQQGSARLNGVAMVDPVVAANGRTLEFAVGDLGAGQSLRIRYVTEVTAGTPLGDAINVASARDVLGATSNTAQASIEIRDEFLRERNILVGRVIVGNCPAEEYKKGHATLRMQSEKIADEIHYTIQFGVNGVQVSDYRLFVDLPDGADYVPGSVMLDGYRMNEPASNAQGLEFGFTDQSIAGKQDWQSVLSFKAKLPELVNGRFVSQAYALMNTQSDIDQTTPIAKNIFVRKPARYEAKQFLFRPVFSTLDAELDIQEVAQLDKIIAAMRDSEVIKVTVEGHADARPVSQSRRSIYNDNVELSWARARAVAPYFQAQLNLSESQIDVSALGDAQPIADNTTTFGQTLNRRVDLAIDAKVKVQDGIDKVILADSGELKAELTENRHSREKARVGTELKGLAGVRVYMEDGTYVLTDDNGKYHIENVRPGAHVVQLDLHSLPSNMRVIECEQNTRFAGSAHSRTVDLKPGSLWRVDFHVEPIAPVSAQASLVMKTKIDDNALAYQINSAGGAVPVSNYRMTVILPEGVQYVPASSYINKTLIDDPQISGNILIYRLGDFDADWDEVLEFKAEIDVGQNSRLVSKAAAIFDNGKQKGIRIAPVETVALVQQRKSEPREYVFEPRFKTLGSELSLSDKRKLDSLIADLLAEEIQEIKVIGHTDNVPISAVGQTVYKDNYALSLARAKTVANYLQLTLGLDADSVIAKGMGADQPIAANDTSQNRARNRRTEIFINTTKNHGVDVSTMVLPQSRVSGVQITGESLPIVQTIADIKLPPSAGRSIEMFAEAWMQKAQPGVNWLMPSDDFIPAIPAVNVAIQHRPADLIKARLNGEPLNPLFFFGTKQNKQTSVAVSYWQGIHLQEGANQLEFSVEDAKTQKVTVLKRIVHFSDVPFKAELVKEYSHLIADGKTSPVLAVRFYDQWGQLVRPGVKGDFAVLPPYMSQERLDSMEEDVLAAYDRNQPVYEIGEHGIALIKLEPTTQTGKAALQFAFNGGREQMLDAWLKPASRDWIVVGLAEGVVGSNDISGDVAAAENSGFEDGSFEDGKLAFFAKGNLSEDWLLTASVDTSKEPDNVGNRLFQTVDPDEFFTLYGDQTEQRYEAPSAEKVFVKFERDHLYAMFGDYETGLSTTELSKYNRSVTGIKSEYEGELFSYNLFVTETSQRFIKDEIQGDGTSGLYTLSQRGNVVINSETIIIETRDRFRSQDILDRRTLRRHYDYNIDYQAGTVFFREPIQSRDRNFNPVFIVIDYESETNIEDDPTYGGRGAFNFADGKAELGFSLISDGSFAQEGDLYGIDLLFNISEHSELKLEYADSEVDDAGVVSEGSAYLAEINTRKNNFDGRVYVREQEAGFGLGQQAGSESGTRKYGVDGSYQLNEHWRLNSEAFHEDNLGTNAERDIVEADISYTVNQHTLTAGLRKAKDEFTDGQVNESELLVLGAATKFLDGKLHLYADSEIALDSEDANSAYPTRHIVGLDYYLTSNINTYIEQEITEGEFQDTSSTRVGVRATPWSQARIDTSVEEQAGEYGPRTFAVLGLTQGFRVNQRWSADFSFDRSKTMREVVNGDRPFNVNVPPQSGTFNDDFSALSLGTTYRGDTSTLVNRLEHRDADSEDKRGVFIGWHRDQQEGIAFGVDTQWFDSDFQNGTEATNADMRFSLAYRPVTSKWIHLNRLDYKYDRQTDGAGATDRLRKFINNWKGNYMPNRDHQLAFSYGLKYALGRFDGDEYDGVTHYAGTEYRYDIGKHWDLGVHASQLYSANAGNRLYSYGISTGWDIAKNLWLSVGYNFDGFEDEDFSLAEYTAKGPYMKLRFKFDQNTLGLNRR